MLVGALFDFDACHVRSRGELPQVSISLLLDMSYRLSPLAIRHFSALFTLSILFVS